MILTPKEILLVLIAGLLPFSLSVAWYMIDSSDGIADAEPKEDYVLSIPYIIDEEGRIRIVSTVSITMDIKVVTDDTDTLENNETQNR